MSSAHLCHRSFSNPSFASPTSQYLHLRHLASSPRSTIILLVFCKGVKNIEVIVCTNCEHSDGSLHLANCLCVRYSLILFKHYAVSASLKLAPYFLHFVLLSLQARSFNYTECNFSLTLAAPRVKTSLYEKKSGASI